MDRRERPYKPGTRLLPWTSLLRINRLREKGCAQQHPEKKACRPLKNVSGHFLSHKLKAYFGAADFASPRFCVKRWRKRVGVEPTIRLAKSRINGFEGHEDHRTPFASVSVRSADYAV